MTPRQRKQKRRLFIRKLNAALHRNLDAYLTPQIRKAAKAQHWKHLHAKCHWFRAADHAAVVAEAAASVDNIVVMPLQYYRRTAAPKGL